MIILIKVVATIRNFTVYIFLYFYYIRDAAWEAEPNAYADLLERHSRCDLKKCKCPQGREYNKNDRYVNITNIIEYNKNDKDEISSR